MQKLNIDITHNAIKYFKHMITENKSIFGICIKVKKTGCSGWMFDLKPQYHLSKEDICFKIQEVLFCTKKEFVSHVEKMSIDLVSSGLQKRIVCKHAQETARCGCGESFTLNNDEKTD